MFTSIKFLNNIYLWKSQIHFYCIPMSNNGSALWQTALNIGSFAMFLNCWLFKRFSCIRFQEYLCMLTSRWNLPKEWAPSNNAIDSLAVNPKLSLKYFVVSGPFPCRFGWISSLLVKKSLFQTVSPVRSVVIPGWLGVQSFLPVLNDFNASRTYSQSSAQYL